MIRVARPEDLVIYKLVAGRPQDVDDVEKLLALHVATIDLDRVRAVLQDFCATLEDDTSLRVLDRFTRPA